MIADSKFGQGQSEDVGVSRSKKKKKKSQEYLRYRCRLLITRGCGYCQFAKNSCIDQNVLVPSFISFKKCEAHDDDVKRLHRLKTSSVSSVMNVAGVGGCDAAARHLLQNLRTFFTIPGWQHLGLNVYIIFLTLWCIRL